VFLYFQLLIKSAHDFHHAILGLTESLILTNAVTDIFKVFAGRLRPNFLARCTPNATGQCTSLGLLTRDARLSFPSGHSSIIFAAMTFLSCYLAGKLRLLSNKSQYALWKLIIVSLPMFIAGMVAISRTLDYHHNHSDIMSGSAIGLFFGIMCYLLQYPSLFRTSCHLPKNRYYITVVLPKTDEMTELTC
jgi:diacylglycerol diphosphate phosphatase/phosphatidate phosphatase